MNKLLLQAIRRYGKEGVTSPISRVRGGNRPIKPRKKLRIEDLVTHLVDTHIQKIKG